MKKSKRNTTQKIIQSPIAKIVIGGVVCILIPVLINKLVLDNVFQLLGLEEDANRGIRVFITTFILMPLFYFLLFRKLEEGEISELRLKQAVMPVLFWFLLAVGSIALCFSILLFAGFIEVENVYLPKNIVVNVILIASFVITEELFFRAILYRIVEERWGTVVALITSAVLFAVMHLSNENSSFLNFTSVVIGSCVLGISYTYTKSVWVPMAFHFGWNLSQVFLGFGLSGGNEFNDLYVLKFELLASRILTGGTSGVENSIFAILLLATVFIIIIKKSNIVTKPE